jgi:hypothetical protein
VGGHTVVRRDPVAGNRGTVSVCDNVRAIPLQNGYISGVTIQLCGTPEDARSGLDQELTFSGVAFTADWELVEYVLFGRGPGARGRLTYDPGVEEVSLVWRGVGWRCDRHCDRHKV